MGIAEDAAHGPDRPERDEPLGRVDLGPDGGEFSGIRTSEPITDWTHVFKRFNLDPAAFEIIGDTVRSSTWEQSKRLESGERDIVQLYSYRAQFRRRATSLVTEEDIEAAQKRIRTWRLPRRIPGTGLGAPSAAVLNLADMQIGKSEGGGIEATEQRLYDGLDNFQSWLRRQRKGGRNITELVLVNNGDPGEGIAGNYPSQTHTVQGGLRKQMNLVLDVWEAYSRELFPQFEAGQFVSVLCNHMEFGRQGGAKQSITSDSDNGSAFLAETLRRILSSRPEFDDIRWTIPHDEMNVFTDIAGVLVGFNHGHKIPGADATGFEKWLNGQVRGDEQAHRARVWITAHRHNYQSFDLGSATVHQCPSCDGGSKWLRDTTGKFARSGILALLVGEHEPMGWSDVAFL
ncbi:MAG: hypothetical protein RJQ01_08050 [Microcella sp.]|uniref:hypothetical protein n=1 Tax=Microcella sp. TaxID=1913979 RepID=UPI0033160E44